MNPYLADILDQPNALRLALRELELEPLEPIRKDLASGKFDRIVLTGMGASYLGLYPAWLLLAQAGLPAIWVDAAELVHHTPGLVGERTLLWVASQSGRSAEVVRLVEQTEHRPPRALLAVSNEPESPLGQAGRYSGGFKRAFLPLNAIPEENPSTRTYLNTLAIVQLAALSLDPAGSLQTSISPAFSSLMEAAGQFETYLSDWKNDLAAIDGLFSGQFTDTAAASTPFQPKIALVGRGPSLTTALCGALCIQEAAKIPAMGFQAGEFRHGPLEMAGPYLTVLIFEGDPAGETASLNRKLWKSLRKLGANAWLLTGTAPNDPDGHLLALPSASGIGLPLAETIPVQLLCYYLAERTGLIPGEFKNIGKVTAEE